MKSYLKYWTAQRGDVITFNRTTNINLGGGFCGGGNFWTGLGYGIGSSLSGLFGGCSWFGGGNIDLLGNPKTALLTVIAVICWQFTPFYMVYFMAAFTNIPYDVFEAARIDGATRGQYFWKIALPLLVPSMKSAAILSMVGSLKYFDLIYVMTGGGPGTSTELMATYMYKESFSNFNMGYGSAVAGGMFILISLIALITMKLINGKKEA